MAGLLNQNPYGGGLLGRPQPQGLLGGIANFFRPWTPEDRARVAAVMPPDLAPTQIVKGMVGGAANLAMQANEAMPWGGNNPQAIGYDPQAGTIDPSKMIPFATDVAGMATTGSLAAPAVGNGLGMGIRAYHGSPHDFDRFLMDKIGTGEGGSGLRTRPVFCGKPRCRQELPGCSEHAPVVQDGRRGQGIRLPQERRGRCRRGPVRPRCSATLHEPGGFC